MGKNDTVIEAFTELAPRYEHVVDSELKRFWGWTYSGFIDQLISMTQIKEGQTILDIATGTAVIPRKLLDNGNTIGTITGLDITLAMLQQAKKKLETGNYNGKVRLTCATALSMPYAERSFDLVMCGLATHHMDVSILISESHRVLKEGGYLSIADVGGSALWRLPGINSLIRLLAFLYFSFVENTTRAWAEAASLSNIRTAEEWQTIMEQVGFTEIETRKLPSSHFWAPSPLVIRAFKPNSR